MRSNEWFIAVLFLRKDCFVASLLAMSEILYHCEPPSIL
jgi:hypothetical protein